MTGHASTSRVRRLRIWIALRILPRDWSAAGPALNMSLDAQRQRWIDGYRERAGEDLAIAESNLGAYEDWPPDA